MTSTTLTHQPLLANNWHHGHWIVCLIVLLLVAAAIVAFVRRRHNHRDDGGDSARRILGERFARGEINADEYRERLGQLQ